MNRLLIVMMLFLSAEGFAQQGPNRFDEESTDDTENSTQQNAEESVATLERDGPGNPGEDPVPIDDYLPVLVITALGMIVFAGYRKKQSI